MPDFSNCAICGQPIALQDRHDAQRVRYGIAHSDCYYGALGDEIEKHPIGLPHPARSVPSTNEPAG